MSSTWIRGLHAVPSLCRRTDPRATAEPTRLLRTMSSRSRGETPYAVANRRKVGEKLSVANPESDCSDRTFEDAYAVSGANGAASSTAVSESDAPYMLHEDANTKRSIPAARASV